MTELEIQCLKDNIDRLIEIETTDGELLVARVLSVFHNKGSEEHEMFYELLSTNIPKLCETTAEAQCYALDFDDIMSVRPHSDSRTNQLEARS